jgi:hypothetical protein
MRIPLLVVLYVVLRRFCIAKSTRARSSARLERTPDKREVGSSSLPGPTKSIFCFAKDGQQAPANSFTK